MAFSDSSARRFALQAINRARVSSPNVEYAVADLFAWRPAERYDFIFMSFWLSHVPADRFAAFWTRLADCVVAGGQVVFVDEHVRHAPKESWLAREVAERTLADGTRHRIVKSYLDPSDVTARLATLGWHADVDELGDEWVIGQARVVRPAQVMGG